MSRLVLILVLIFSAANVFANHDKIAVIVNNSVITEKEILDRNMLFITIQGIQNITPEQKLLFRRVSTQSLIDEVILEGEAKINSIKVSKQDVDAFISNLERSKKLEKDFFKHHLSSNKGVYASFLQKMRGDLIKTRLNNEILMRGIVVSDTEVEGVAVRLAGKDQKINVAEYITYSNDDKSYALLNKARKSKNYCVKKADSKGFELNLIEKKFSEFSKKQQELLSDLKVGDYSAIVDIDGKLHMYHICSKVIQNATEQEIDNFMNYIGNKKLSFKMIKYIEILRKKAYIKYIE